MENGCESFSTLALKLEEIYWHIDEQQFIEVATVVARKFQKGEIIFLSGDLGSGKTTFTKAACASVGIDRSRVHSPTFSLIHCYSGGRIDCFHLDCYRIDASSFENLGFFDLPLHDSLCFIEWPENVSRCFQSVDWLFRFQIPEDSLEVRDLWVYRKAVLPRFLIPQFE